MARTVVFRGQRHDSWARDWPVVLGEKERRSRSHKERSTPAGWPVGIEVGTQRTEVQGFDSEIHGQPRIFLLER